MSVSTPVKTTATGRWTKEEHEKFILGIQLYGKEWKKIQQFIETRNGSQIRSHAQKFFIKVRKESESKIEDGSCSKEEESEVKLIQNSNEDSQISEDIYSECSYFMQKIIKASNQDEFDFWSCLIDSKSQDTSINEDTQPRRKDSFVTYEDQSVENLGHCHKKIKVDFIC